MNLNRPDPSKLYQPPLPALWWMQRRAYFLFIVRELTCVFIAAFLVVLLVHLYRLGTGIEGYSEIVARMQSPGWIVFHVVALVFAIYHSVTWFQTTSIVMAVKIGGRELPRFVVTGMSLAAWTVVSVVVLALYINL